MGRGIALVFAYAGYKVDIIDFKPRDEVAYQALAREAGKEIRDTLAMLAQLGMFDESLIDAIMPRIKIVPMSDAKSALTSSDVIFEGVPEVLDLKREVLAEASRLAGPEPIIASTTSTILVDDLSGAVDHPERFLNAHWLNPAYLVPLVEMSAGAKTASDVTARLKVLLEAVGKVPVLCAAIPGYIVPRIQLLVANEAARMVEEGVASPEDLDKAFKFGFGFRFSVLGILEFIDWGGGDILYYASRYMTQALGSDRYAAPEIIERNMREGRVGFRTQKGFLNYESIDLDAHRRERTKQFIAALNQLGLTRAPVP
jgi:3-hydroxybutyryl-CoA dehydrogenase